MDGGEKDTLLRRANIYKKMFGIQVPTVCTLGICKTD